MKKIVKKIKILLLFLLLLNKGLAQIIVNPGGQSITVNVLVAPPYTPYLSDYKNKSVIKFTNLGDRAADLYLQGSFTNDRGQYIRTKANVYTNIPIHVPSRQTVVLQGSQLDGSYLDASNVETNFTQGNFSSFLRLGLMPEGYYTFCIKAFVKNINGTYTQVNDASGFGTSCAGFNIGYVTPPNIVNPITSATVTPTPNNNLNISWTKPVGNLQGANLVYDLYVVKVLPGVNYNTAMQNALQYGAGLYFRKSNLASSNFQFIGSLNLFPLEEGSQYALMVQSKDLNGTAAFENNGQSPIVNFTYGATPTVKVADTTKKFYSASTINCSCKSAPDNSTNNTGSLKAGGQFTIDGFTVKIVALNQNNDGSVSGIGTVGIMNVPIQINFSGIKINNGNIAFDGLVTGTKINLDSTFNALPKVPTLTPSNYSDFLTNLSNNVLSVVQQGGNAVGVPLPFSLKNFVSNGPKGFDIGVIGLNITPDKAWYDAIATAKLPEEASINNILELDGRICFTSTNMFCGKAVFGLGATLDLGTSNLQLQPVGFDYAGNANGTFAEIDGDDNGGQKSIKTFQLGINYTLPDQFVTADGSNKGKVVANLIATIQNDANDWIASANLPRFYVSTVGSDKVFTASNISYDHSLTTNPTGVNTSLFKDTSKALIDKNKELTNDWKGFYIQTLAVTIPSIVKSSNGGDTLAVTASNFLIDDGGVTGMVQAGSTLAPIIGKGGGNLGGWACTLDNIGLLFVNNSFIAGGLSGRLHLPISKNDENSYLQYTSTLTNGGSDNTGFSCVFSVTPNNVDFSAWYANLGLNNSSSIIVTYKSGDVDVTADLSAALTFNTSIGSMPVNLTLAEIDHLKFSNKAKFNGQYYDLGNMSFGKNTAPNQSSGMIEEKPDFTQVLAGPFYSNEPIEIEKPYDDNGESSVSSFPIQISPSGIAVKGFGIEVPLDILLTKMSGGTLPNGHAVFTISSGLKANGFTPPTFQMDTISVHGPIGGAGTIDGTLNFSNGDSVYGNGVSGSLKVNFTGLDVAITAWARFGKKDYDYWFVNVAALFSPGFVIATDVSLTGVGGGAYYNMAPNSSMDTSDPKKAMEFFSGIQASDSSKSTLLSSYVPKQNSFGFNLEAAISTSDGYILQAYGYLGATFDVTHGFKVSSIQGGFVANILNDKVNNFDPPPVTGTINFVIDIANSKFSLDGTVHAQYPTSGKALITADGALDILADAKGGNYYIKMGHPQYPASQNQPSTGIPIKITIEDLAEADGYFQAGTSSGSSQTGIDPLPYPDLSPHPIPAGYQPLQYDASQGGMIFGSKISIAQDLNFLMFYLNVNGKIGFDVGLLHYGQGCNGQAPPGINGWYASGQVYAGFNIDFGLSVDVFFYHGNISVLQADAGFLLEAGLPNPYWFKGMAYFDYNVLNGAITGSVNYEININSPNSAAPCVPQYQAFQQPLIKSLSPANSATNVSVVTGYEVQFNYPVGEEIDIVQPDPNNPANQVTIAYQVVLEQCNVKDNTNNIVADAISGSGNTFAIWGDDKQKDLLVNSNNALNGNATYTFSVKAKAQQWNGNVWVDEVYEGALVEQSASDVFTSGAPPSAEQLIADPTYRAAVFPFQNQRYFLPGESQNGGIVFDKDFQSVIQNCTDSIFAKFTFIQNRLVVGTAYSYMDKNNYTANTVGSTWKFAIPQYFPPSVLVRMEIIKRKHQDSIYHTGQSYINTSNHITFGNNSGKTSTTPNQISGGISYDTARSIIDSVIFMYHFKASLFTTLKQKAAYLLADNSAPDAVNNPGNPDILFPMVTAEGFDVYDVNGYQYTPVNGNGITYFTQPLTYFFDNSYNAWISAAMKAGFTAVNPVYISTFPEPALSDSEISSMEVGLNNTAASTAGAPPKKESQPNNINNNSRGNPKNNKPVNINNEIHH